MIAGAIMFILYMIFQWLPFFGVLAILGGIIGFFTGSDTAGKMFLLGIILLTVRFTICSIIVKFLDKSQNSIKPQKTSPISEPPTSSHIPVTITQKDIEKYEKERLKELEAYRNDPSYNFDD